jgi:putative DNA primase/helicase
MINLAGAAHRLGNPERQGRRYLCDCPSCGAHAAWVMEGKDRRLRAGCFRREDWKAVRAAIDDEDYEPAPQSEHKVRTHLERIRTAERFWSESILIPRTAGERYLERRGVEGPFPDTLRFHRAAWHFSGRYPALVARIERFPDYVFAGVHLTYLAANGDKAGVDPDRLTFGVVKGAGVWLAGRRSGGPAVVGEGIETVFSAMAILGVNAGVAALSAPGMRAIALPTDMRHVWIAADHDASGTGERAAEYLATRLRDEGRRVQIATPDIPGSDFNDLLLARKARAQS